MPVPENVAEIVIQRFGGLTALAGALGHKYPTTVQGWRENGVIPIKQWPEIERAAAEKGFTEITVRWLGRKHGEQLAKASA